MSRRHAAEKRTINPDPKYGDWVISKFMNVLMLQGKKSVAEGIVYGAFEIIEKKTKQDAVSVFHEDQCEAKRRSALASRRWCYLSGADGSA